MGLNLFITDYQIGGVHRTGNAVRWAFANPTVEAFLSLLIISSFLRPFSTSKAKLAHTRIQTVSQTCPCRPKKKLSWSVCVRNHGSHSLFSQVNGLREKISFTRELTRDTQAYATVRYPGNPAVSIRKYAYPTFELDHAVPLPPTRFGQL